MIGWAAFALAAAFATPAAAPPDPPSRPAISVMLVETSGQYRDRGLLSPPDMEPEDIPWHSLIEMRVRVLHHVWGPSYARTSNMIYVAHAAYIRGVRVLVIAEPRADNEPGFFVRWYTTGGNGDFCVPTGVVAALQAERAFTRARRKVEDGAEMLCVEA